MIGRLALLLLLISLPQGPSGPSDRDAMQESEASSASGLKIVQFSYEEKLVQEEQQYELPSTATPPTGQLPPPGRVSRNDPDITPSRDLSERMRDLRQLPTAPRPPRPWVVRRYLFNAQMKNEASKTIKRFVWAYQPQSDQGTIRGKDYLCNSRIEPGALQAVKVLSPIPRSTVVSASDAGQPSRQLEPAITDLGIKFVEFEDGSTWQHPNWNATSLISRTAIRKLGKGKCTVL